MAAEFKLPDLGESIESADVVEVLVAAGDKIEKETPILEAETDKAVMEIPSTVAGTVKDVQVKKGDTVKIGQVILTFEEDGEAEPEQKEQKKEPQKEQPKAQAEEPVPDQSKAQDEAEAEETPKPSQQPQEPQKEEPQEQKPQPAKTQTPIDETPTRPRTGPGGDQPPIAAAPSVRQFAREIGVDIYQVTGNGPGGRISIDDVKAHARSRPAAGGGAAADGKQRVTREKMSKIRRVTAAHMAKAWETIPHVTIHDKADVTDIEAMRKRFKKQAEAAGGKLTITAIFVKIATAALKAFPNLNASIDTDAGEIEHHNYYNIGVAVDTPRGLVVPVIRDADRKSIIDIAVELTEISSKARDGKLTPDDMSGGTFTITNLGSIGTGLFMPIVNHPEVAILGMGRAVHEPVYDAKEDAFDPRLMAPLSLSIDHRLVDGADGARFLRWIVEAAENPMLMSLEG